MTGPNPPDEPGYPRYDPNQPGYPTQPGYPNQPSYPGYPGQPPLQPPPPRAGLTERLGDRALRRAGPRVGVSLAGAGIALAIVGVLVWSGTYLVQGIATSLSGSGGGGDADSRRLLGVFLSLAVIVIGYVLAIRRRSGPLSAAGVAASALGVPMLMAFLTFSLSSSPISIDAIAWVSMIVWLLSYLLVPGTRGHVFYLGATAAVLYGYILDKIEPHGFTGVAVSQVQIRVGAATAGTARIDTTTIAAVSLIFGLAYYAIAFALDRHGRPGIGVAFVYSGFGATVTGLVAVAEDVKQIGTGILLIVLGGLIATFAARSERRFTTWAWSAAVPLGVALIIAKAVGSEHTVLFGILLIVFGAALVAVAAAAGRAVNETDELTPSPSGAVH